VYSNDVWQFRSEALKEPSSSSSKITKGYGKETGGSWTSGVVDCRRLTKNMAELKGT
jgi:hypothetical protein